MLKEPTSSDIFNGLHDLVKFIVAFMICALGQRCMHSKTGANNFCSFKKEPNRCVMYGQLMLHKKFIKVAFMNFDNWNVQFLFHTFSRFLTQRSHTRVLKTSAGIHSMSNPRHRCTSSLRSRTALKLSWNTNLNFRTREKRDHLNNSVAQTSF